MNASSDSGNGSRQPPQPEGPLEDPQARSRSPAAEVGASKMLQRQGTPRPAETLEEFVTLHQLEIFPTGPDPRRDPRILAMHGGSRQRRGRGRPRSKPYAVPLQPQSRRSSAMGAAIPTDSDNRSPQSQHPLASSVQSRSVVVVTSTGVADGNSHTNQGQPSIINLPYHTTPGPQYPPLEDTTVYTSPYGGYVYQSPEMARLDPSPGRHNGASYRRGSH